MIRPGASGGVVVDAQSHRIVGVLNGIDDRTILPPSSRCPRNRSPISSRRSSRFSRSTLFPLHGTTPPDADDIYPEYTSQPTEGLQHRA